MNIKQKKKGVSEVVSVVLIIMITVAAITLLWTIVIPMIKESTTSGAVCFKATDALSVVDDSYTCFKKNASADAIGHNNVSVKISKNPSEANISYAQIVIYYDNGGSDSKFVDFRNIASNTENTYTYNITTKNATSVAVAAILTTGKKNSTCAIGPKVVLSSC